MSLKGLLFFSSVVSTSVYMNASGGFQPSIALLIISSTYFLICSGRLLIANNLAVKSTVIFLLYTIISNGIWSFSIGEIAVSSFQQIFNLYIFLSFCTYCSSLRRRSVNLLIVGLIFTLMSYLVLATAQIGRYNFPPRYNGFFNDPNQMSYWLLCIVSLIVCFTYEHNHKRRGFNSIIAWGLGFITVVLHTLSRSGLVGFVTQMYWVVGKKLFIGLLCLLFVIGFNFITYFETGLLRFASVSLSEELYERGYLVPLNRPEFLIFGAGHGGYGRFDLPHEIHSSLIGAMVYYGIPVTSLFCLGILFSNVAPVAKVCFISLLAYGMTTYGLRTPIFWLTMAVIVSTKNHEADRV